MSGPAAAGSANYFDPELLAALSPLRLRAARVADGWSAGGFLSRRYGSSVDFADHKAYSSGDDVRHIDWKLNARTDRFYVRRFNAESSRLFHFLLDGSGSMGYRGTRSPWSKWDCAATLAASLMTVALSGGDAAGWSIATGDAEVAGAAAQFEPLQSPQVLDRFTRAVDSHRPAGRVNLSKHIRLLASTLTRRTNIIVVSDWLDPTDGLRLAVAEVLFAGHQVLAAQVLDRDEVDFPGGSPAAFVDAEDASAVHVDPLAAAAGYADAFERHQRELDAVCQQLSGAGGRFAVQRLLTDRPLAIPVAAWLDAPLGV